MILMSSGRLSFSPFSKSSGFYIDTLAAYSLYFSTLVDSSDSIHYSQFLTCSRCGSICFGSSNVYYFSRGGYRVYFLMFSLLFILGCPFIIFSVFFCIRLVIHNLFCYWFTFIFIHTFQFRTLFFPSIFFPQ